MRAKSNAPTNGEALGESYISEPDMPDMAEITVEEDGVFVMGDHRCGGCSQDSRVIGEIPINEIVGEAVFVIWPLDRLGGL